MIENNGTTTDRIVQINIEEEMKTAYIDYSMSVIVSRALPDVRDGLKPVQRRVMYSMSDLGLVYNKPYKKSARIVGETLGKYHPHGDSSVYDAMVRMAQDWSLRYLLVEGQGNFGSVDGDPPAAMRYTEARLTRISQEMIDDLDKDTVNFQLNFDDSLQEPTVMPSRFPNLLVNGASGIAVGMATNMLPHNLREIIDGIAAYIDDRDISIAQLCQYVKAPDFPTGGVIYGISGVQQAFATGRGKVIVRGRADVVTEGGREKIVITEIPYQINKSHLVKKIADLVNDKKIDGIQDIRDESDRNGMRIVCDLRRDANSNVILSQLYNFTQLQTSFGVNNVCLVKGRPRLLNLKELITYFVEFRHEVVIRRTAYQLRKAEERAHILEGFLIALDHLDEVIALIRNSPTPDIAREGLMSNFGLSEIQSKEILNMRLQRLTGLERDKIRNEYDELMKHISWLQSILANEPMRMQIIKDELAEIRQKYGDERRTAIEYGEDSNISIIDMIDNEQVAVTISHLGYIKRTSLDEYREQHRGGKGAKGSATRDDDFIEHLFIASTHDYLLVFTENGICHWLKVYEIPEGAKVYKGRAIQNLVNLQANDKVKAYLTVEKLDDTAFLQSHFIVFATKNGIIKKTSLEEYSRPRANGIRAINIEEGDSLLEVRLTNGNCEILLGSYCGKVCRFNEANVRPMGRTTTGVKGITLSEDEADEVVGMVCIDKNDTSKTILSVSEKGYGKRSELEAYRVTSRGAKGVTTLNVTEKTGHLIAIKEVSTDKGLMIICKSGIAIRMSIEKISVQGRNTQGIRLINLTSDDAIAGIATVPRVEIEAEEETETVTGIIEVSDNTVNELN